MTIKTSHEPPPIPTRDHDWSAWCDELDELSPIGYGRTEAEAIADLHEQLAD